jgi:hypothetical protein
MCVVLVTVFLATGLVVAWREIDLVTLLVVAGAVVSLVTGVLSTD